MNFLFTCDAELTSVPDNEERDAVADELLRVGLPRVLDLCARFDVPATVYFTANLVDLRPECLDLVRDRGHEIGCHGLRHDPRQSYDALGYEEQLRSISAAREVLRRHGASDVSTFRAPEARIGPATVRALSALGFTSDSSVCPQRFDGPLSRGFPTKLRWLAAPRRPYFLSPDSVIAPGDTNVLEIPISALLLPFIGTTMRVSPGLFRMLRRALFWEARRRPEYPLVFLFHPNECLDYDAATGRGSVGGTAVADRFRTSLKLRNLGAPSVPLVEELLRLAREAGFEFTTASRLRRRFEGRAS